MPHRFEPLVDDRQSIRLPGYDYARAGSYFVTMCVARRERILGRIQNGAMALSEEGRIVLDAWERLPSHYPHVRLDEFVTMPNHVHGIVVLTGDGWDAGMDRDVGTDRDMGMDRDVGKVGAGLRPAPTVARATIPTSRDTPPPPRRHALPEIVRAFKSFSARAINADRGTPGTRVWQRNYYERIIRDQRHLDAVRRYIRENPAVWGEDRFH